MSTGFFALNDEKFEISKDIKAIKQSKVGRNQLIALFGGVQNLPSSIMRASKKEVPADEDEHGNKRSYTATTPGIALSRDKKLPKHVRDACRISGCGTQSGALSTFPQNIGRSMVLLYSNPGDTVFDPFAGHNSRMDCCVKAGRHYIGCDLSTDFMDFNFRRAKVLRKKYPKARIKLHHGDSRKISVDDEVGDFTITSPPYWDIEEYGDEPEQLGKQPTYKEFLESLLLVMQENYRCLKPGAFAMWFVNDFRRDGRFISYHIDTIRLMKKAGFIHHDLLVVDLGRTMRDCFLNQIVETKILPKRMEFGIVFRKPA